MKNWRIRRYKPGDETQIILLFQDVFGKKMGKTESIKHWKWEYRDNPNDRLEILLAVDENKIVGHYAVIPVRMKIGSKEYLTSLSLDTMTRRNYRGQGMFPTLATKLYDMLGKSGIPITYGFPNPFSIHGFIKKLNWFEISDLPIYTRPMDFILLFNRYLKIKFLSKIFGSIINTFYNFFLKKKKMPNNIKIEEINKFDKEFDDLWELNKNKITVGIIRDSKYLNWRYFQRPEGKYVVFAIRNYNKLKGYIVLNIEERFNLKIGLVMDILADSLCMDYHNYLINHSMLYFKDRKVTIVSAIMFPHCVFYKSLKRNLFMKMFKIFFPYEMYFGARINNDDVNVHLIKDPYNWYLTWGDTDV